MLFRATAWLLGPSVHFGEDSTVLRKARSEPVYNLLAELQRRDHLFTYLIAGGPKTTSRLEGDINSMIKQTLRLHRGMGVEYQKRAAEWVLIERAGLLQTAAVLQVREDTGAHRQRPRFTEPYPGPVFYDTGLDSAEGALATYRMGGKVLTRPIISTRFDT